MHANELPQAPALTWPGQGTLGAELRGPAEQRESGQWKRTSLGKNGKVIMVIFLE